MSITTELGFPEPIKTLDELAEIKDKFTHAVKNVIISDKLTGEVYRCRTPYTSGSKIELEVTTNPSETDISLYEPIDDLMRKMSRADALRALKSAESALSNDDVSFDDVDIADRPNFDLCDVPDAMEEIFNNPSLANATPTSEKDATTNETKLSEAEQTVSEVK